MGTGLAMVSRGIRPSLRRGDVGRELARAGAHDARARCGGCARAADGRRNAEGNVSGADLDLVEEEAQRLTGGTQGVPRRSVRTAAAILPRTRTAPAGRSWRKAAGRSLPSSTSSGPAERLLDVRRLSQPPERMCAAIVVEPQGAEAIAGGDLSHPDHPIQGGGYSRADLRV